MLHGVNTGPKTNEPPRYFQVFMGSSEEVKKVEKVLATKEAKEVLLSSVSNLPVPVEENNPINVK